jgi:anaerobic selenocysteine-containing dehydrogenase
VWKKRTVAVAHQKYTFCRICEPACPLVAEFDDNESLVHLSPDLEHPCGGVACHKGLSFLEIHNDPDRLNWPQKRTNPRSQARGDFVETDWDGALSEIGNRLKALRGAYGPNTVAFYFGNAAAFNAAGLAQIGEFQDQIDTKMRFGANTQDAASKVSAAQEIYGSSSCLMTPDFYNTHYLLCLGSNPKVSRWTTMSAPNDYDVIKEILTRGGKVRFVNPRKVESSTRETGPTLLIKPGTDVYFLAAVLNVIEAANGLDEEILSKYGKNLGELKHFIAKYPPEKVATVTGIGADQIRQVAAEFVAAKSAVVFVSTGVSQSRQGTLSFWLAEMINFTTGNLGREGGSHKPTGLINHFPPASALQTVETSLGPLFLPNPVGYSLLPAVLLADLIENGDIRALITVGGNPLLSVGGEDRMRRACEKLDTMVTIDIYRSATAEISDFVLPATDWLERADINLLGSGLQPIPFVQYTDAMTPPAAGRRNEWWILARLAQVIGVPSPLDDPEQPDNSKLLDSLLAARGLSIDKLRELDRHTVIFPQERRDIVYEWCLQHPDGKIDCCPSSFEAVGLFERSDSIFSELEQEPADTLKLVSLRTPYMHNTWFANSAKFRRGKHSQNPLNMCESDASVRALHNGDSIRVFTEFGSIETQIFINDDLRPGVVAMSHGFGNKKSYGLQVALENPGANYNALMPVGVGTFEPLSYMSWLNGVPVKVEKLTSEKRQRKAS